jgi:hypothetical protein
LVCCTGACPPGAGAVHMMIDPNMMLTENVSELVVDEISPVVGQIRAVRVGAEQPAFGL